MLCAVYLVIVLTRFCTQGVVTDGLVKLALILQQLVEHGLEIGPFALEQDNATRICVPGEAKADAALDERHLVWLKLPDVVVKELIKVFGCAVVRVFVLVDEKPLLCVSGCIFIRWMGVNSCFAPIELFLGDDMWDFRFSRVNCQSVNVVMSMTPFSTGSKCLF